MAGHPGLHVYVVTPIRPFSVAEGCLGVWYLLERAMCAMQERGSTGWVLLSPGVWVDTANKVRIECMEVHNR